MAPNPDRRLIRYLHGELPVAEVRALRAELARDPALAARLAELDRMWQGLRPPPPTPAPFGYVPRLQRLADARQAASRASLLGWGAAPPWARALAGAALVAGTVVGLGLGRLTQPAAPTTSSEQAPPVETASSVPVGSAPTTAGSSSPTDRAATVPSAPEGSIPSRADAPAAERAPSRDVGNGGDPSGEAGEALDVAPLEAGTTLAEEYWQALEGAGEESGESESRW